ncbi:hypothetical protein LIER_22587 [Lithospermum erythrorhizon]|uniref:SWIM-type domain-containing protein n=1 Tax=Lithospermum erythrorhizon TaxID=34254 RepID=A0AAV3QWY8_LITER
MYEVFNSFIIDAKDKSILTLMSMVKEIILVRMQLNRDKAEKWEGKLCPKPRAKLLTNLCDVDLEKRQCSCRKWKLTDIPCKHACAVIKLNGDYVEDFVDECYIVGTYKKVYAPAIQLMAGPELWPQTGRQGPLPPPMIQKKKNKNEGNQGRQFVPMHPTNLSQESMEDHPNLEETFKPPTNTKPRPSPIFFAVGQKFATMKDISQQ